MLLFLPLLLHSPATASESATRGRLWSSWKERGTLRREPGFATGGALGFCLVHSPVKFRSASCTLRPSAEERDGRAPRALWQRGGCVGGPVVRFISRHCY